MADLITPRTLSGFRDYLPAVMLAREEVLRRARDVYRSYGFTPIDTPACESLPVLLGKGGDESDKLVYRVLSARGDKAEMGLRFDLTVPFARFSAQYINELGTPFKRYAMGPVWRGERPGQGRYREFWQCDFDTIGTTSNAADIETALVVNDPAAAALAAQGVRHGYVNLGGDLHVIGPQPDGKAWQIGIQDPRDVDDSRAAIGLIFLEAGAAGRLAHVFLHQA